MKAVYSIQRYSIFRDTS